MRKTVLCLIGIFIMLSTGVSLAADAMSEKEASPTLKERITKDAVKGTLTKTEGDYYYIKNDDGKEVRVHVDTSTKMDKVLRGDRVNAYITDQGHVTTFNAWRSNVSIAWRSEFGLARSYEPSVYEAPVCILCSLLSLF